MFISHKYRAIFIHIQRTGGNSIHTVFQKADPNLVEMLPVEPSKKRTKHCFASDIQERIDAKMFKEYTIFCVVRNPFDRMVSWYFRFKRGVRDEAVIQSHNRRTLLNIYVQGVKLLNSSGIRCKGKTVKWWNTLFRRCMKSNVNGLENFVLRSDTIGSQLMIEIEQRVKTFKDFVNLPKEETHGLFERFYMNQLDYISINNEIVADKILRFERLQNDFEMFAQERGLEGKLPHRNTLAPQHDYRTYYTNETKVNILQRFHRDFEYFKYTF